MLRIHIHDRPRARVFIFMIDRTKPIHTDSSVLMRSPGPNVASIIILVGCGQHATARLVLAWGVGSMLVARVALCW